MLENEGYTPFDVEANAARNAQERQEIVRNRPDILDKRAFEETRKILEGTVGTYANRLEMGSSTEAGLLDQIELVVLEGTLEDRLAVIALERDESETSPTLGLVQASLPRTREGRESEIRQLEQRIAGLQLAITMGKRDLKYRVGHNGGKDALTQAQQQFNQIRERSRQVVEGKQDIQEGARAGLSTIQEIVTPRLFIRTLQDQHTVLSTRTVKSNATVPVQGGIPVK